MKKKLMVMSILFGTAAYGSTIDLDTVLNELKRNNYEIKAQEQQVEIDDLNVKRGFKNLLPGANLAIDTQILNNEKYKDGAGVFGPQKITAGYTVFAGGRIVNNYNKIKKDAAISKIDLSDVGMKQEIKAIDLYFQVLNLEKQIEITNYAKENLVKQKNRLEILFKNNKMVSKNELLGVEADIMAIDADVLDYRNRLRVAKEKLFVLIGKDINSDYSFKDYYEEFAIKGREQLERDIRAAEREGNTALKKNLEVEKAELDVKLAKAAYYPTIKINGEYRLDDALKNPNAKHNDWGVELVADMNVFQWGATMDDVDAKKIALDRKEREKRNALKNLEVEIRSKYSKIELLHRELKIAGERVKILEENSKIQNIRFTNGMISSMDYLNSIQQQRSAEERRYILQKDLIVANREYNNLIK